MKMDKILLVCALPQETNSKFIHSDLYHMYTGVGKINATYKLTKALLDDRNDFDLVINYGTAASKTYSGLVDCTRFRQRDMDARPLGFDIGETPFDNKPPMVDFSHIKNPINKNLTCYTGDSFVTDIKDMDVVDMEAYALAKVCERLDTDFISYKYISDDGDADDWKKNCGIGINKVMEVLKYYERI